MGDESRSVSAAQIQVGRSYRWQEKVFTVLGVERHVSATHLLLVTTYSYGLLEIHEAEMVWPED
jgi:hypothetical protein